MCVAGASGEPAIADMTGILYVDNSSRIVVAKILKMVDKTTLYVGGRAGQTE